MTVQAKVRCLSADSPAWDTAGTMRVVRFTPVYDADPNHPNYQWSQATPSGYLELNITNPSAFGEFTPGNEYMVTFEADQPAPAPAPVPTPAPAPVAEPVVPAVPDQPAAPPVQPAPVVDPAAPAPAPPAPQPVAEPAAAGDHPTQP